jgi:hypothetical protein
MYGSLERRRSNCTNVALVATNNNEDIETARAGQIKNQNFCLGIEHWQVAVGETALDGILF